MSYTLDPILFTANPHATDVVVLTYLPPGLENLVRKSAIIRTYAAFGGLGWCFLPMQIKDITIEDIRQGKNWKAQSPDDFDWEDNPLEELPIVEATEFEPEDTIIYSVIVVYDGGEVKPLVQIKRVQDLDYGGDFCEIVNGKWQQLGLIPNPNAPLGTEYVANPLEQDESFISDDHDYRAYHREGFRKFAALLR